MAKTDLEKGQVVYVYADKEYWKGKVKKVGTKKATLKFDGYDDEDYAFGDILTEAEYKKIKTKAKEKTVSKKGKKEVEEDEEEVSRKKSKKDVDEDEVDDDLSGLADDDLEKKPSKKLGKMTRAELKEYIADNNLDIKVVKSMSEEDIVEAIEKAEEDSPEKDEEEESSDEDFEGMTRKELKAVIVDKELDVKVTSDMEDEDIVKAIHKAIAETQEDVSDSPDEEEEDETPRKKKVADEDEEEESAPKKEKWYSEGDDNDAAYAGPKRGTFRLWLAKGKKVVVTFVTGKAFTYREHHVKINGEHANYTCLAPSGERCPLCEAKNKSYVAKAFFVVDHSEFEYKKGDKKGETGKDTPRMLVLKQQAYDSFKETVLEHFKDEDDFSYAGLHVMFKRSQGKMSYSTGDIFIVQDPSRKKVSAEVKEKYSRDKLIEETAPLDRKLLAQKVNFIEDEPDYKDED